MGRHTYWVPLAFWLTCCTGPPSTPITHEVLVPPDLPVEFVEPSYAPSGLDFQLVECAIRGDGSLTATIRFQNIETGRNPPLMNLAIGSNVIDFFQPALTHEGVVTIQSDDLSPEGRDQRLVSALSRAELGRTECAANLADYEGTVVRPQSRQLLAAG